MHAITQANPAPRRTRRRHSNEFKVSVVAACKQPGASVAAVALANGVNANLVRRWLTKGNRVPSVPSQEMALAATGFVPVQVASPMQPAQSIGIELRRGAIMMTITWPTSAGQDCASWIRELLR